jgi:hypothetical protein
MRTEWAKIQLPENAEHFSGLKKKRRRCSG